MPVQKKTFLNHSPNVANVDTDQHIGNDDLLSSFGKYSSEHLKDVVEQLKWVSEAAAGNGAVWGKLPLKSEVAWAGMTIVIELLLDVHHVSAGVLQLPELCASTEVSKVAELWQPRPRRGICVWHREESISIGQTAEFHTFLMTKLMS